jgi:hypothetical protein
MYSPKLDPLLVPRLYRVCQQLEVPMTQFINQIVGPAIQQAEEQLSEMPAEGVREQLRLSGSERRRKNVFSMADAAG